jgi:hypothetical protein
VLLGACALLAVQTGTAAAQQCKTEIDNVAKVLASRDAGTGPTTGMATPATPGSPAQSDQSGRPPQHPPTAAMDQATGGGAASPQDVQGQTRGEPTAAERAQGAQPPAASEKLKSAQAALQRAREFEGTGREAECMSAIAEAKQLMH